MKNLPEAWHHIAVENIFEHYQIDASQGLSYHQVKTQRALYGTNTLPQPPSKSFFKIVLHQFLSPLIYILLAAAALAYSIGDEKDAAVILVVVILNAIIGSIQEGRAERSMESLRKLSQVKAHVLREGQWHQIEAQELVPGDLFSVAAGDSVPTDARLLEVSRLFCAEAALTGESLPVSKQTENLPIETSLADRSNMIYAGTLVTVGRGLAIAVNTGQNNEVGHIAKLTSGLQQSKTQLEKRIQKFGKQIVIASILLSVAILFIGLIQNIAFSEIFMVAVSQMVSLVPEGLPVALTIALAVGLQRMAKRKTIVRELSAVESLGSTTVICTDKTGTLTKNEMTAVQVYLPQSQLRVKVDGVGYQSWGSFHPPQTTITPEMRTLLEASVCCNDANLISDPENLHQNKILGDPTEAALLVLAKKAGLDIAEIREQFPRKKEWPFDSEYKMMATEHLGNHQSLIFIKGAPEALFPLCQNIDPEDIKASHDMASAALRVLAIGRVTALSLSHEPNFHSLKNNVEFLGLIGELDPPRTEVASSIQQCNSAGIRTIMVTGDHKSTAASIGKSLGILQDSTQALDGLDLEKLSDFELNQKIDNIRVFARVHPSQKLRIVRALQDRGHVVAMTGDGVNDAPALAQADVGVAMGITGTEVAKEASKIIITDDNFSTLVTAVHEGRLVYQNIKKLILFLFVTSIDEVLILFLALILGYPPPLAAVQILWINLVSEGALTVNLILEPPEGNEMNRPPLSPQEPLIDRTLWLRMPLMILSSVASTFGWFLYRTHQGVDPQLIQTETFTLLVVSQWFNVLNCRSATKSAFTRDLFQNPWLIGGLAFANLLHVLVIYWSPLANFFHTVPIPKAQFLLIGVIASFVLWTEELRKYFVRRKLI